MSIRGMQRRMSRHLRVVLYVTIGVFIVGLPAVFVPQFAARWGREQPEEEGAADVVARVDGRTVTRGEVEQFFDRMVMQILPFYAQLGQAVRLEQIWPYRLNAMEQAVVEELLVKQAETEKLSASGREVRALAEQMVDRDLATLKASLSGEQLERELGRMMTIMDGTPRDSATERRFRDAAIKRLLEGRQELERNVVLEKLRQKVVASVSTSEQDLLSEYDEATVREIQVALHPEGKPERTEEEARKRAEGLAARAKGGEDFAALARAESDDPEAKETGGLVESARRGTMASEWADAVFALAPDDISDPIKLPWGFAVVKMGKLERKLPEDFESRKEQLLGELVRQKQDRAWAEYQQGLREKAKVETVDPEMLAWQALMERKEDEALAKLQEAATARGAKKGAGSGDDVLPDRGAAGSARGDGGGGGSVRVELRQPCGIRRAGAWGAGAGAHEPGSVSREAGQSRGGAGVVPGGGEERSAVGARRAAEHLHAPGPGGSGDGAAGVVGRLPGDGAEAAAGDGGAAGGAAEAAGTGAGPVRGNAGDGRGAAAGPARRTVEEPASRGVWRQATVHSVSGGEQPGSIGPGGVPRGGEHEQG